eukprot:COSAG05_NODE_15212_length_375_cov_1.115942_1_plen_116_part_00
MAELSPLPEGVQRVFVHAREILARSKFNKRLSPEQRVSFKLLAVNAASEESGQQQQRRYEALDVRGVDSRCVDEEQYQKERAAAAAVQVRWPSAPGGTGDRLCTSPPSAFYAIAI